MEEPSLELVSEDVKSEPLSLCASVMMLANRSLSLQSVSGGFL